MTALLEARGLGAGYGEVHILTDVSFAVAENSITALVGSNGAGKTTLMRTIAGLLPLTAGRLSFANTDMSTAPPHARVDAGIALVPEGRMIFPDFTVEENLDIGAFAPHARPDRDRVRDEMFTLFPRLAERRRQRGETLSGGEQQMLALARGLMSRPRLLLLDEPSLGLAPVVVDQLFETIVQIRGAGLTVFIVEQDVRATLEVADNAYVMENGRVTLEGAGSDMLDDPAIKEAYLGL